MGRFAGLVAAGTVAAMTLAGCSSGSDAEPSSETLPTATVTVSELAARAAAMALVYG